MKTWAMLCSTLVVTLLGCNETPATTNTATAPQPASGGTAPPPPAIAVKRDPAETQKPADDTKGQPAANANAAKSDDPDPTNELQPGQNVVKAEAGVGRRGRGYGGGIITEPIHQYFNIQQTLQFDVIKHDMDLYHAQHNRYPRSMEEFQKEIIEPGQRILPDLPEGEYFVYEGELFVARPDPNAPPQAEPSND